MPPGQPEIPSRWPRNGTRAPRNAIPTAAYKVFDQDNFDEAAEYIKSQNSYPVVLKADGLAGGKGVLIPESEEEAMAAAGGGGAASPDSEDGDVHMND